jgi:hypothetical protein
MATVWPAQGTTLSVDETSGNSNTFSLISNITSLENVGGGTVAQALTTALAGLVHTFRGTLKKPAEIALDMWYDPTDAVHRFLRDWDENPTNGPYTVQGAFNTGNANSTATALSNISGFDGPTASDVEANLTASATIQLTGYTTWVNS